MSNSVTITREEFTKAANATIDFLKSQNIETSQTLFCSYLSDVLFEDVKADVVEVVRCKDCKHRPTGTGANHDLEFPDDWCPCQCAGDYWYSWMPPDDWFCAYGERKETEDKND